MRAFLQANKKISDKLGKHLSRNKDLYLLHEQAISACSGTGLDIGAGRHGRSNGCIAADLSAEELRNNPSALRLCMDASTRWPFPVGSLDFIASRWTIEHLPKTEAFFREAAAALKPGGRFIHLVACRYSLIGVLNLVLPHSISLRLLRTFFPESKDVCGFEAHYDQCWPSAMRRLCEKYGLEVERIELNYMQAWYFSFFVPLFLLCLFFDWLRRLLRLENTCHCVLLMARKQPSVTLPPI